MLMSFYSCSNEPAKSGQLTSEEKSKNQVSEEFQRNLASAKAITDGGQLSSKEKPISKVSEEFKSDLESASKMTNFENHSLVGMWECNNTQNNESVCDLLWQIKSNNTYNFYLDCESGEFLTNGTWHFENNYISTTTDGVDGKYKISWINNDRFILEGGGVKRNYSKTYRKIPEYTVTPPTAIPNKPDVCRICWGTKTENCGRCVSGKVRQQVQRERYNPYTERNDIYYEDEYVNCWEYGCNNGQVKCSFCKGTGYRN